jgi:uncharacterized protein YdaU (DUF1376 family)
MANKDPAFLFYPSDFLTGTMLLSNEQIGKYIKLLCLQHQHGSLSEKHMLQICGEYDEELYSKFKKDDDGKYYNERLQKETIKRKKYSESRRKNRMGGAKKDEEKPSHDDTYDSTYVETYDGHMENRNRNIDISTNKDNVEKRKTAKKDLPKKTYGEFNNVKLTDEDYEKLKEKFPDYEDKIEALSIGIDSKGYKYKNHYSTILNWDRRDKKEKPVQNERKTRVVQESDDEWLI